MQQLQIDFEAGLTRRYSNLIEVCRAVYYSSRLSQADRAKDMDMAPSLLSRKMADNPNEKKPLQVAELESFIDAHGDQAKDVIFYLIEKYLDDKETRRDRALDVIAQVMPQLQAAMDELGLSAASERKPEDKDKPSLKPVA